MLRAAEVDFGQGWLFGRPAEAWPADPQASAAPLHVSSSGGGRLERALASAPTVRDASAVVVEHLARTGLMPSVYLEQGGRLRCQASRGYWQVYDGMPSSAGVIGLTFRTGTATEVSDITDAPRVRRVRPVGRRRALHAAEDRRAHASASSTPSPRRGPTRACAGRSSAAPTCCPRGSSSSAAPRRASSPRSASPARSRACPCSRTPRTSSARPSARRSSSPASSPRWSRSPTGHGSLYVHHAEGPFAVVFSDLALSELDAIANWVSLGTSSYTVAETSGRGFAGHQTLRGAGAALAGRAAADGRGPAPRHPRARRSRCRTGSAPSTSSCSSCSPSRPRAGCAWRPPCSSCASAPRATR